MTTIENRIRLVRGDITCVNADAVVTAANEALCSGGGVDGAIHDAAGPELLEASRVLAPCLAGSAKITNGFNLTARFVIHAVGPIFRDYEIDGAILAATYQASLSLAVENHVASIVFPCISTGAFGFPADEACEIAINTVVEWIRTNDSPIQVIFCCFESRDYALYQARLNQLGIAL
jgi:O-acetyl-ADP-ribose deacetylase (regulator of RNase III)